MADSKDSKPPKKPLDPKHSEELERTGETGETPSSGVSGERSEGPSRRTRSRDSKKSTAPSQTEKSEPTPRSSSRETSTSSRSTLKLRSKTSAKTKTAVASSSPADEDPEEIHHTRQFKSHNVVKIAKAAGKSIVRVLKPKSQSSEEEAHLSENMDVPEVNLPQSAREGKSSEAAEVQEEIQWGPRVDTAETGQEERRDMPSRSTPPSYFSDTATETTSLSDSISLGSRREFPSEVASCADSREGSTRDLSCPERELERRSSIPMKTGQKRTEIPLEEGDYKEFDDSPCKRPQLQDPDSPGESPKDSGMTE